MTIIFSFIKISSSKVNSSDRLKVNRLFSFIILAVTVQCALCKQLYCMQQSYEDIVQINRKNSVGNDKLASFEYLSEVQYRIL